MVYGVVHDQVTARICVEYFTIGHVRIIDSDDPTVLGFVWGIVATWWAGAFAGILLATAARYGNEPKVVSRELALPLLRVMGLTGTMATLVGVITFVAGSAGLIHLWPPFSNLVPIDRHVLFLTDLWVHNTSYACGFFFVAVLIYKTWTQRRTSPSERNAT